jgi:hypothetical protein
MEHIVTAASNVLKEELDEKIDATTEPSRFMRFMHIKYKCVIIIVLGMLAAMSLLYLMMKDVLRDEEMGKIMTQSFDLFQRTYFPNRTDSTEETDRRHSG